MSGPTAVVVGSSVGGARAVQALRAAGYAGGLVLVGEEPCLPYDKPPLSKAALAGTVPAERLTLLTAEAARDLDVRLLLGRRAERLDVAACEIELDGGEVLPYDDVVVATGARARPSPWGSPPGVHLLRTSADADALRADLCPGEHLVVVGGGFIGAEVAATACGLGLDVTVVDPLDVPMARVVGHEVGALMSGLHGRHGVATRFGVGVESVEGERGALRVGLTDGRWLEASAVVVGIGAVPNDGWLDSSGLLVEDGVVCDEHCRALGFPRVHAVGDVARWWHPRHGERVRVEHWTNAVEQATVVAHNITHPGELRSYAPVEYIWSDQYDWKIQIAGRPGGAPHAVVGDPDGGWFAALYGAADGALDGPLGGVVTVNWPKALVTGRRALLTGTELSECCQAVRQLAARRVQAKR